MTGVALQELDPLAARPGAGGPDRCSRTGRRLCRRPQNGHQPDAARRTAGLDPTLIVALADEALATADPDLALNNLERLFWIAPVATLAALLAEELPRRQLLTILGASPFLTSLLCRRAEQLAELFGPSGLAAVKDEAVMQAELRRQIPDGSSFELLQQQLRLFKAREILRIGSRDLCGLATLEEVTAELSALAAATLQRACEIGSALLRGEYGAPLLETAGENAPAPRQSSPSSAWASSAAMS